MPGRKWTKEDDALLLDLRAKGLPRWQIAATLATSRRSVGDRLRRIAPELRVWNIPDDLTLMSMAADGATFREIAAFLDRSYESTRQRWMVLMGVHRNQSGPRRQVREAPREDTAEACEKHLQAILAADPRGFMAWSEKRVGVRGVAPCAPVFFPLRRAA